MLSQRSPSVRFMEIASIAVALLMAAAVVVVWLFGLEGPVPIHFNAAGEVDGWASRKYVALLMAACAIIAILTSVTFSRLAQGPRVLDYTPANWSSFITGWTIGLAIPCLFIGLMSALALGWTPPPGEGPPRWLAGFVSLVFLIVGGLIGKTSPNPFVGVRTPWSRRSRLAWDKSNRLAGRSYFAIGLVGLIGAPFMPMPAGMLVLVAAVLLASAWAVYESYRVWRIDPDRAP